MRISRTKAYILVWQKTPEHVMQSIARIREGCALLGLSLEAQCINKKIFSKEKFEKLIIHLENQKRLI